MEKLKIDLVIPLFNKKNFIKKTIKSSLEQYLYSFNKIYIINDASTDNVENVLIQIQKENKNQVEVISLSQNKGVSEARNIGIKSSKADYITFLDADDELSYYYLFEIHRLYKKFHKQNPKILSVLHQNIYHNEERVKYSINRNSLSHSKYSLFNYTINKKIICSSGITIKKEILNSNSFPSEARIGEDIYLWIKLLIENDLYFSRQTLVYINKNAENRAQLQKNIEIPYFIKKYKNLSELNKNFFLNILCFNIFFIKSLTVEFLKYKASNNINTKNFFFFQSFIFRVFLNLISNKIIYNILNNIKKYFFSRELNLKKSFAYILVTPTSPLIFLLLYLNKNYNFASKFLIYSSGFLILTQILSFHNKNFLKNNIFKINYFNSLNIRFILTLTLISLFYIFAGLFEFNNFYLLGFSINTVLLIWNFDYLLFFFEKLDSEKGFNRLLALIICFYFSFIITGNDKYYFYSSLIFLIIIIIIFLKDTLRIKLLKNIKVFKFFRSLDFNYFFITAFLLVVSNYLIRVSIGHNFDDITLATIFLCLSIATFPGSLYSQIFAQYNYSQEGFKNIKNLLLILQLIFILFLYVYLYVNATSVNFNIPIFILINFIGAFFHLNAQFLKNMYLRNNEFLMLIKIEILYFISLVMYVLFLTYYINLLYTYILFNGLILFFLIKSKLIKNL